MNHRTVKAGLLAVAIVLPGAAFANAPAPESTESYSGSLAELATGVRSTPPQPTTIQSPRDSQSGLPTGAAQQTAAQTAPTSSANPSQPDSWLGGSQTTIQLEGGKEGLATIRENDQTPGVKRTETVNANEVSGAQDGSGTDNANRKRKPRSSRSGLNHRRVHKP